MNTFDEEPHLGAIVSVPVQEGREPVHAVWHEHDGDWIISCTTIDVEDIDSWITLHVQHVLERHPTLHSLGDLPLGWAAFRDQPDMPWEREPFPDDA